ncbi:MAG: rhodanese-like domain-containing protein [Gammaproteobacteria bacterium]
MAGVPELTPTEFAKRWPAPIADAGIVLLDVREPVEVELASVQAALHIPMRDVPTRLMELDREAPIVVMCHTGRRSYMVAQYLVGNGFSQVFNLRGGIDAWSTEIDPQVPRY